MTYVTPLAWLRSNQMVFYPYIVESEPGRFNRMLDEVHGFDCFGEAIEPGLFGFSRPMNVSTFISQKLSIPMFNMTNAILPREAIPILAKSDNVRKIYPDELLYALDYPTLTDGIYTMKTKHVKNFMFTSTKWTKILMGGDIANNKGYTGRDVTVAVLDTGGTRWHEQTPHLEFDTVLRGQFADHQGHGEWCAACIGGKKSEDEALSKASGAKVQCEGFVPDARLVGIKCLGYGIGTGSTSSIIKSIELAVSKYEANILSMSLGGPCNTDNLEDDPFTPVFRRVISEGVIPVIAAGNEGPKPTTIGSPGWIEDVLTVGAYDPITGEVASFSSRGPTRDGRIKPDVMAPGVNIDAATLGLMDYAGDNIRNRYSPVSGTSMATPHVAGLVTSMFQCHAVTLGRLLTVEEIKDMARTYGRSKNNTDGWGHISWSMYEDWVKSTYGVAL